jgi:hypothetical protein
MRRRRQGIRTPNELSEYFKMIADLIDDLTLS